MNTIEPSAGMITISDAPAIPGLSFRRFRGESDYLAMVEIVNASNRADGSEWIETVERTANEYAHLTNCDPSTDMIFAEVDWRTIGYGRVMWRETTSGERLYILVGFLQPDWRRRGIGRAIFHWQERRLREIAADHVADGPRFLEVWTDQTAYGKEALLTSEGYRPVRYFFEMVRPDLDDIPEAPLPPGMEVRPALPEHYRVIWDAGDEAFRDEWSEWALTESDYQSWLGSSEFCPDIWKVAWDRATDQVAGMVLGFIDHEQNETFQRLRGWTENICVRRPWRKRGVARALIAENLRELKARGMTEAALGVDTENPTGALRLYERMGFRPVKRNALYRKPLVADGRSQMADCR